MILIMVIIMGLQVPGDAECLEQPKASRQALQKQPQRDAESAIEAGICSDTWRVS